MNSPMVGWLLIMLAAPSPSATTKWEEATLTGKVVEVADALKRAGLVFDAEPIAKQLALRDKDGGLIPLLSDEASRAFFLDERLRGQPVELRARRFAGLPYAQVLSFRILHDGKLRTPEYYCEICTISVRYPQSCPCCQGPMVLRMRPEAP